MKKTIINILATTGVALVILSVIATINGGTRIYISSVLQTLGAVIVIHLGLLITRSFEIPYAMLESTIEIVWTLLVLVASGAVFGWYASTPVYVLVIMGVIIYLIALALNMIRMKEDVDEINRLLRKRSRVTEGENRA